MGSELPILEYARVERVGGGDRYRLWFLLAGLPGIIALKFGNYLLASLLIFAARLAYGGSWFGVLLGMGLCGTLLIPFSALLWRLLRLGGGKPGLTASVIGLAFGCIHIVGILALTGIALMSGWESRMVAVAVGAALLVCGGFMWWNRTRLDMGAGMLLLLVGVEMVFWAVIGLAVVPDRGTTLGLLFEATAVVRGVEWAHVLRSRGRAERMVWRGGILVSVRERGGRGGVDGGDQ